MGERAGRISLAGFDYAVGATFAGEPVEVVVAGGLVEILHAGVLVATHAQRLPTTGGPGAAGAGGPAGARGHGRADRDPVGRRRRVLSFAGASYGAGMRWARQPIQVSIVAGSVQLSKDGNVIRVHPIRHDRSRDWARSPTPKDDPDARTQPPAVAYLPELRCRPGTGT